jgi:hypothetical protein
MGLPFNQNRNPGPLGQVRDDRLCRRSNLFMGFRCQVSGVSAATGLKGGQFNRKRNFEKANTRLPCIVRRVGVIID